MDYKYSVIEIQTSKDGVVAYPPIATYDDRNQAESKYHTVLAAAAVSDLARHTAMLISDDGRLLDRKCYERIPMEPDVIPVEDSDA